MDNKARELYDNYREKVVNVQPENISDFSHIKRLIQEDETLIEYGLVDDLLIKLAQHRTHMLDRIDEAVTNY